MKAKQMLVALVRFVCGENPRINNAVNVRTLADNIAFNGLKTPLKVFARDTSGNLEVIQGHRRLSALRELERVDTARFNELFARGIPCEVIEGISAEEALDLKLDHSDNEGLNDPYELQMSANMLFAVGKTEEYVASRLAGLIEKFAPLSSKVALELKAISEKIEKAKAEGNSAAVILAEREYRDRFFAYRRGFVQGLHAAYRCPNKVMHALFKKATGKNPEDVSEFLPALTTQTIQKLWKAHEADLKILENGQPKYNKTLTGPLFNEAWASLIKAESEKTPEEPRAKAMSAKDMVDDVTKGEFTSELACKLTAYHAGNKELKGEVIVADKASYIADLVRKNDTALWSKVEEAATEILKRLQAVAVEVKQ